MNTTAQTASAITDEQKALADWVRDGIADFAADNWPMKKYSLEEIEAAIRTIEINIPAKFGAPTAQPVGQAEGETPSDGSWLYAHKALKGFNDVPLPKRAAVEPSQPEPKAPVSPSDVEIDAMIHSHRWRELHGVRTIVRTALSMWAGASTSPAPATPTLQPGDQTK